MAFAIDWSEWRAEWSAWRENQLQNLKPGRRVFPPKNFLADDVIGVYRVGGQDVELSEVTFPDLGSGSSANRVRYVGITWLGDDGSTVNGGLVDSFTGLEESLRAGRPSEAEAS